MSTDPRKKSSHGSRGTQYATDVHQAPSRRSSASGSGGREQPEIATVNTGRQGYRFVPGASTEVDDRREEYPRDSVYQPGGSRNPERRPSYSQNSPRDSTPRSDQTYLGRPRRQLSTSGPAYPPSPQRPTHLRQGSRAGPSSPQGSTGARVRFASSEGDSQPKTHLWSINLSCPRSFEGVREFRILFPRGYTAQQVANTCCFASCERGQVYLLNDPCGEDCSDGHWKCHNPIDPARMTSDAVSDPDRRFSIRRCTEAEEDPDSLANDRSDVRYVSPKYEVGSKDWHEQYEDYQKDNRRQRRLFRASVLDHFDPLQNEQDRSMETANRQMSQYLDDSRKEVKGVESVIRSLMEGENANSLTSEAQKQLRMMQEHMAGLESNLDSLKSVNANFQVASQTRKSLDWHLRDDQDGTIRRLRSEERDEARRS